jgi:hypothetical protein
MALSPQRKPKKTVLVLPHDERIQTVNGRVVFRYPNGNGGHVSVDSDAPHFSLICIGLWDVIWRNSRSGDEMMMLDFQAAWIPLASGELEIADVKFRQCTKRERKELGL